MAITEPARLRIPAGLIVLAVACAGEDEIVVWAGLQENISVTPFHVGGPH